MYTVKYRNMTIITLDTIEEVEEFTGTNQDKDYTIEEVDSPEPTNLDAQRQSLHDDCMQAYLDTGTVRSDEWKAANAKLGEFERKHGREYNPD